MDASGLRLVVPHEDYVDGYRDALVGGWSPSTLVENSAKMLDLLDKDRGGLLARLVCTEIRPEPPRVPLDYQQWWIWDGSFCGLVVLIHQPGTEDLPENVLAHVGYNVVPWKQGRGYATLALTLLMDEARSLGLNSVRIACRPDNITSCRVAEKAGARLLEERVFGLYASEPRRLYELVV